MSNNKNNMFGTDPVKLRRTHDPFTSVAASEAVNSKVWEERTYKTIGQYGPDGCISDQVRACWPSTPYSTITARYEALETKGFITCGPDTRKGKSGKQQRVMRAQDPPPECNWVVQLRARIGGKVVTENIIVHANNERKAIILAKRKLKIKVVSANKMPDWIQP